MLFLEYPPCSTCKKAKAWLDAKGVAYTARHIKEENPSYEELKLWYGRSGLPLKKFFNTSGLLYKSLNLKDKLPTMTEEEQLRVSSASVSTGISSPLFLAFARMQASIQRLLTFSFAPTAPFSLFRKNPSA